MADMSWCPACVIQVLLLLLVSNGAPVMFNKLLGPRYAWPVDNGLILADGGPLFGNHKTWRGVLAGVALAGGVAGLLHIDLWDGLLFGGLAMTGDLLSSFIKRRIGSHEGSRARGLDTIPESLLPVWGLRESFELSVIDMALIVGLFFLVEEGLSPILYKLHIRKRPY